MSVNVENILTTMLPCMWPISFTCRVVTLYVYDIHIDVYIFVAIFVIFFVVILENVNKL